LLERPRAGGEACLAVVHLPIGLFVQQGRSRRSSPGRSSPDYDLVAVSAFLDVRSDRWFTGLTVVAGIVSGTVLWLLTAIASRLHLAGNGWSLAGNGVLIIPFGLGPAVVAGGWAATILRMRGHPRWLQLGIASGGVGLALVSASLLSLIVFGPAHRDAGATASLFFGFLLYGWLLAGAITAALVPAPDPDRVGPPLWPIAAILLLPATLIGGCEAGAAVLPT